MSLRINQNILSIKAHASLSVTSGRLEKSIEKLSSGLRINRAADDAAGLAISEKLRRQIKGLSRAILNAQDGISMLQSAEGAMSESHSILQRMRELAIQASNDTLTTNDRLEIQKEINQLRDDLDRISRNTEFNTKKLLDGSQSAILTSSSTSVRGVTWAASETTGDLTVSMTLKTGGISEIQRSQIFTVNDGTGNLAKGNTKLEDVSQFYDANGSFVFATAQTLTVNGNSQSSSVTLDAQMTLDQLAAAIQNITVSANKLDIANTKVGVVTTATTNIAELGGYLEIISGRIGDTGKIRFSGDQALINALGMAVTRESKNNIVEITAIDSTGSLSKVRTESNRVTGLIDGIDLIYDSQAAQIAGTQGIETGLSLVAGVAFSLVTSVAGAQVAQFISLAAGNWTMNGIARSINDQIQTGVSLGGMTATVVDGEIRLSYEPGNGSDPTRFAIANISSFSNPVGFMNGTYNGFVTGAKDTGCVKYGMSRFIDGVNATQSLTMNDGLNSVTVTLFTATSLASVADMVTNYQLTSTISTAVAAVGSVAIRGDVVGDTIAFTSTRIGRENLNAATARESLVALTYINTNLITKLDMNTASVKGTGDKNFQVHVVNNQPQFQIGADQGQTMKIAIGNMSSEALGVNNLDMTSIEGAQASLSKINKAIDIVSAERSKLGAIQNRLEYSINNLTNTHSNLVAAESRIRDADIASEMIEFTRDQIVSQSGTAMLAQANLQPQGVLQLLQ